MARMAGAVLAALLIVWAGSGVAQPAMRRGLDTTETFYDVQGTDHRSVLAALNARGPKGYHAFAEWKVSYTYWTATRGGKCAVDRVETTMSGSVIMPRWATRDLLTGRR